MTEKHVPVNSFPIMILCDCTSHVALPCEQRNVGSSKEQPYEDLKSLGEAKLKPEYSIFNHNISKMQATFGCFINFP